MEVVGDTPSKQMTEVEKHVQFEEEDNSNEESMVKDGVGQEEIESKYSDESPEAKGG